MKYAGYRLCILAISVNSASHSGCGSYLLFGELGFHQGLFVSKSGFDNSQCLPSHRSHRTSLHVLPIIKGPQVYKAYLPDI
jgi:hypothetical protein